MIARQICTRACGAGLALALAGMAGCRGSATLGEGTPALALTSSSIQGGDVLKSFTCDGVEASPELAWGAPPAGTQSFALIAVDRDSPLNFAFVHWVLYDFLPRHENFPKDCRNKRNSRTVRAKARMTTTRSAMWGRVLRGSRRIVTCLRCTRWIQN